MKKTVTISSAELRNLNSVPKVLVAAQPGKIINPIALSITTTYGGTIYANVFDVVAALGPDKANSLTLVSYSSTLFTNASDQGSITPPAISAVNNLPFYVNQPVILTAASNFTLGNGTAKAVIVYEVMDV